MTTPQQNQFEGIVNNNPTPDLSIVSPVFQGAAMVEELVQKIREAAGNITERFEIVLVEDGSPDMSWAAIEKECEKDKRVKGVRLSRNFGQHFAITAALAHAKGAAVVVMDCDLQDDPKHIPELFHKLSEGHDIVYAKRETRNYSFVKNLFSRMFYKVISWISNFDLDPNIGNYTILSRKAVDAFLSFNDYRRGYLFVLNWLGFRRAHITVEHHTRGQGASSYSIGKLIALALDMALSYSDKPLRLSIYSGLVFSAMSFGGIVLVLVRYFQGNLLPGWASTIIAVMLIGGLLMVFLGIIGLYVSKMFEQTKQRPLYLVQDTINLQS